MIEDGLKLTTYFAERDRAANGRLVADELLDLYGEAGLHVSLLLRGARGFGGRQHLHTDRLLTLSEDLPVVSVAVDSRERIEALVPGVAARQRAGLVTLEHARVLTGELDAGALPDETKLTIYLGRRERAGSVPAFVAVCDLMRRRGLAGATVLLGVDGTQEGRRVRARFLHPNDEVPLMVISVGAGDRIAALLPELGGLLRRPLTTIERVTVCKRDGRLLAAPPAVGATDDHGRPLWQKLMVYGAEPTHADLALALREAGVRGASALRGIWGFHGEHAPHGDRLLQLRRRVPLLTVVVDTHERIAAAFGAVDRLTGERGLVTCETVPTARMAP